VNLVCPVHNIPDCSPLLNGCSVMIRMRNAYDAGVTDGYSRGWSDGWEALLTERENDG